MDLTSSKQLRAIKVEETEIAVGEGRYHVWLELVHRYVDALFLRHDELLCILDVMHVPQFDVAVR